METIKEAAMNIPGKEINDDFGIVAKSSVKLIKNSRGIGCEIKVVAGEEHLIEGLKNEAVRVYRELEEEFVVVEKVGVEDEL